MKRLEADTLAKEGQPDATTQPTETQEAQDTDAAFMDQVEKVAQGGARKVSWR